MAIKSSGSFNKILIVAFGLMFGLVAITMGYSAIMGDSRDIRSRASEDQVIFKQWEFNGDSTEDWTANNPFTLTTKSGRLVLTVTKSSNIPVVRNSKVATEMPVGNKYLSISLAVGDSVTGKTPTPTTCPAPPVCVDSQLYTDSERPLKGGCPAYKCIPINKSPTPQMKRGGFGSWVKGATDEVTDEESVFSQSVKNNIACSLEAKICPDGTAVGRSGSSCSFIPCPSDTRRTEFTGKVFYSLKKSADKPAVMQKPISFSGTADGQIREIKIRFPEAGKVDMRTIRIQFTSGVKNGSTVAIDWIRLLGVKQAGSTPKYTPTPTVYGCVPRPACLDAVDGKRCMIKLAEGQQFCTQTPTPIVGKGSSCEGARNGSPCVDTCASACPPNTDAMCTKQCVTRKGVCVDQKCETWNVPSQYVTPMSSAGCVRAGCSGELCMDAATAEKAGVSTCIYMKKYACYSSAACVRQASGQCGWTQTKELVSCLAGEQ